MKVVYKLEYKNQDGIAVGVVKKAPARARTKADVIAVCIVKKKGKKILTSQVNYYTPDEAMGVAMGLITAVDFTLSKKYVKFRNQ